MKNLSFNQHAQGSSVGFEIRKIKKIVNRKYSQKNILQLGK